MTSSLSLRDQSSLPALIARATSALASATTAAEVLEARDAASTVYDLAKRMARLATAKEAHDEIIAAAFRAQADALLIESQAKVRLADEYDAAQERGEVASGRPKKSSQLEDFQSTASDIGLTHKQIHEARTIRDAEKAEPGITEKILNEKLAHGEEPTRASVKKVIGTKRAAKKKADHAENDRRRQTAADALPQAIKDREKLKKAAIATKKSAANGLSDADRIAELEAANTFLEGRVAELEVTVKTYERLDLMYRDWTKGGWEQVVQAKDDTIAELQRTSQTRIARESGEKVRNLNTVRKLAKKLDEAGKGRDTYLDLNESADG